MKKLLLTLVLAGASIFVASAEMANWSVEFKNATNNNQSDWTSTTTLSDMCESGESNISISGTPSKVSLGQYGMKIGQNKNVGDITFNVAAASIVKPSSVTFKVSANKNADKLSFGIALNGVDVIAKSPLGTTNTNGSYYELTIRENLPDALSSIKISGGGSNSNQGFIFVKSITVNYEDGDAPTVSTPTIEMVEGADCYEVTMSCETEGAEIYYAVSDESIEAVGEPSIKYTGAIPVYYKQYFKAVAKVGEETSYQATFTANPPMMLDNLGSLSDAADFVGTEIVVNCPLTVVDYIVKTGTTQTYLYITDGTYNMLVYNPGKVFAPGDKFNKLTATIGVYGGNVQLQSPTFGDVTTGGEAVAPREEETVDFIASYNLYGYFKVENVSITNINGANATITDADGTEKAIYNQYSIAMEEGQKYTVTGFVGSYNGSVQFQPTLIEAGEIIVEAPVFEIEDGSDVAPQQLIPVTAEEGATIYYSYDNETWDEWSEYNPIYAFGLAGSDITIYAYAEKDGVKSETVSVTYHIVKSDEKEDVEVAWMLYDPTTESFDAVTEFTCVLGETVILPQPAIYVDNFTITSDNEAVAYFDQNEWSIVVGEVGTAVLTITVPETNTTKAAEAQLTFTVKEKTVSETVTSVVDFSKQTWTSYSASSKTHTWVAEDGKQFATSFSLTGTSYATISDGELRVYASNGNKITVSAPADYKFIALSIIADESNKNAGSTPMIDGVECAKAETAAQADANTAVEYVHAFAGDQVTSFELTGSSSGKQLRISTISFDIAPTNTAIENVVVDDENAPVEYYNLQGVRVANPENGLYIRRQGSKATKVIIR